MYKKKQLLEMVKILEQTNNSIKNRGNAENTEIIDALTECQELAVEIGNDLESRGEAFRKTVSLLEEYCEDIYQLSMAEELKDRKQLIGDIEDKLGQLETIIQCELPEDKKKVVFLPYKAAMWDSLESIYLSMKDDDKYEAYVMPIPYYDKNEDGSFGEMHYEGSEFPKNIPITSWEEYSLEEERPDIVYIHNPYDNWNIVTSIHPMFYASELKKYTDELVYVPYFVLREIEPDNQAAIDKMSHFIKTPAVLFADKVIVQSEKMKQIYVNEFLKWAKELGLHGRNVDRSYQESRIFGTGSPKFDKVRRTRKEDLEIPEEWLKIIKKPDGSHKKIIFYNITLWAMLHYRHKMIVKVKETLAYFREHKDEIALLWRPHPLMHNTIKTMVPEELAEYEEIVANYQKEKRGIYDDTSDLDRAIVLSDVYYGDLSSVVELYLATLKPVIIQNPESAILSFESLEYLKSYYWFPARNYNALYRMKDGESEAELVGMFPDEEDRERLYLDSVVYLDKLIFVPLTADSIMIYCTDLAEFIRIPIGSPSEEADGLVKYSHNFKFTFCEIYEDKAFFFPGTYPAILILDLKNYTVEYLSEPIIELSKRIIHKSLYFRRGVRKDNEVFLWSCAAGVMVRFNLVTYEFIICDAVQKEYKYREAVWDGDSFWLLPSDKDADILKISEDGLPLFALKIPEEIRGSHYNFLAAVSREQEVVMIPATAQNGIKINKKDNRISVCEFISAQEKEAFKGDLSKTWKCLLGKEIQSRIFAYNTFSKCLLIENEEKMGFKRTQIMAKNNIIKENKSKFVKKQVEDIKQGKKKYFMEKGSITLSSFIEVLEEL